jgi:hypothetical protein
MIKEGDQVVCVDDVFDPRSMEIIPNRPIKDKIYTVREMRYYDMHDKMGVLLVEVKNSKNVRDMFGKTQEPSFNVIRFAPLDKVLDSISIEELEEAFAV